MEAKVPIVPVVFRNVLDALPKGALIVRPAMIEAVVLPAIDTSAWILDTLDENIERIHERYLAILSGSEA
jgi:putative phosphoserine phosphatase/1-acylglycerol-3-phosphate O-acyltransferase